MAQIFVTIEKCKVASVCCMQLTAADPTSTYDVQLTGTAGPCCGVAC